MLSCSSANRCGRFRLRWAEWWLNAVIRPAYGNEMFSVDAALIIVSIWQEAAGIVRGSFRHPRSGTIAMVQGIFRPVGSR